MDDAQAVCLTNYRRGYDTERKVVDLLEKRGYPPKYIARTAGSHSKIDIIAIDTEKKHILFAQCKRSKKGKFPKVHLPIDGSYWVEFRVFNWADRDGFLELDGDGNSIES